MIAERFDIHEQVAEMHSMLAEYHRKLAREARLDIVHDYHVDLAQRLQMRRLRFHARAATLARFHELEKQVTRELGRADLTDPAAPCPGDCGRYHAATGHVSEGRVVLDRSAIPTEKLAVQGGRKSRVMI